MQSFFQVHFVTTDHKEDTVKDCSSRQGIMGKHRVIGGSPFPLAVHAADSVPLGVQLCQGIRYLRHLLSGSFQNHIRLALINYFNLLTQPPQTLLYILQTEENTHCFSQFSLYRGLLENRDIMVTGLAHTLRADCSLAS